MAASWFLVAGLRTSGMLVRPTWSPAWGGVAARVGAHAVLDTGFGVEPSLSVGAHLGAGEPWALGLHLFQPVGPLEAIYGWEYSARADGTPLGERYFGTIYGLSWAGGDPWRVQPALLVRSDLHIDGGACLEDPVCVFTSLWKEGRLNLLLQVTVARRVGRREEIPSALVEPPCDAASPEPPCSPPAGSRSP